MAAVPPRYGVVSVSLPRDLVKRANALIPKTRRRRVIAGVLRSFLDAIERGKVVEQYRAYYAGRSAREVEEERDLLAEGQMGTPWRLHSAVALRRCPSARGRRGRPA